MYEIEVGLYSILQPLSQLTATIAALHAITYKPRPECLLRPTTKDNEYKLFIQLL